MSFDVPIRKNNGKLEAKIRNTWSEIKKNVTALEMYLKLQEGEETIVSSIDLIALAKFYESCVNNYNNQENNKKSCAENCKRSFSSKIDYVF